MFFNGCGFGFGTPMLIAAAIDNEQLNGIMFTAFMILS
jgi:hypothetical protein